MVCSGANAREAAKYSKKLCRAILEGFRDQLRELGILQPGVIGMQGSFEDEINSLDVPREGYSGQFRDDITGQILRDEWVLEARRKELQYFAEKQVWKRVPRSHARKDGTKPVTVRWVEVNKGSEDHPNYRSRLVARQLKARDLSGETFFAPAPPLESLRTVLSMTATSLEGENPKRRDPMSDERWQISFLDITRAYFNAHTDPSEPVYVELPTEVRGETDDVGLLLRHMYGTRRAADGWQEEYSSALVEKLGFKQGVASPCTFYNEEREIMTTVHGDDFTSRGPKKQLDWFETKLQELYELKIGPRLGPGPEDAKQATVLNRIVTWTDEGILYEADPRQCERLLQECGMEGVKNVTTPGIRVTAAEVLDDKPLEPRLYTAFRAAAARANYLAQDRPDVMFAAKEVCRLMSSPTEGSWGALKRLCRYLAGLPRLIFKYKFQRAEKIDTYSDTDWAGCPRTRKSTSGGCIMIGSHLIKCWSSTQASVALSSGEAEYYGVVKAAGAGLGYQALMADFGLNLKLRVWTDSTAAVGVSTRQGLGKLRHLDTHTLWLQQAVRTKRVELRKVPGECNPADLFTKHLATRERLSEVMKLYECKFAGGRAELAPELRREERYGTDIKEAHSIEDLMMLPHEQNADEMDRLYPELEAPPDDEIDESIFMPKDYLGMHGTKIAEEIMDEARAHGRRRFNKPQGRG